MNDGVDDRNKGKILGILSVLFPEAKIYLFGSRARGQYSKYSDIDLALDSGSPLPWEDLGEAKDMFAESNLPYRIDIVDLQELTADECQRIKDEGIVWKA